jgi:hypothetical protein
MTTVVGMLTSRAFTDTIGNLDNAAVLNPNSGTLGVNSTGSNTAASFDNNESWTFDWDVQSSFLGIDVGSFTTAQNERFSVSSTDWIGLSGVMPGTPGSVNFNSATGTFTLVNNGSGDVFDLTATANQFFKMRSSLSNLKGCVAKSRRADAIPLMRLVLRTVRLAFRMAAKFCGPSPVRIRQLSSPNVTSRTQ